VSAYLALLFLAAKGEVELQQDEFYQDLGIRKGDPEALAKRPEPRERFVPKPRPKKQKKEKVPEGGDVVEGVEPEASATGLSPDSAAAAVHQTETAAVAGDSGEPGRVTLTALPGGGQGAADVPRPDLRPVPRSQEEEE
jgi:hypothetical protein